ncbi:nucleoside deaminase [Streptomyces sp. NPDC056983]|uniref:nucleoside deaminase n=1 Tax=Streptomyces sp. NPDC056983 TaxID=3345987 RepID=UPI003644A342
MDRLTFGGVVRKNRCMPIQRSAHESWSMLGVPWRAAVEMAWDSYRQGGIAVGAVLTDGTENIVSRGRNRRFGTMSPRGLLAHAEMEALSVLPAQKDRAHGSALYTTLHPCPMCLGAVVVARVGRLHFGAFDPTWQGIEQLPQHNDEVRRRWPDVTGPLTGPLGEWLAVLPCLNTNGSLVRAMESTAPHRAELARAVARRLGSGDGLPDTADQALEQVWDLLAERGE